VVKSSSPGGYPFERRRVAAIAAASRAVLRHTSAGRRG
jgi:hypothetical protein